MAIAGLFRAIGTVGRQAGSIVRGGTKAAKPAATKLGTARTATQAVAKPIAKAPSKSRAIAGLVAGGAAVTYVTGGLKEACDAINPGDDSACNWATAPRGVLSALGVPDDIVETAMYAIGFVATVGVTMGVHRFQNLLFGAQNPVPPLLQNPRMLLTGAAGLSTAAVSMALIATGE